LLHWWETQKGKEIILEEIEKGLTNLVWFKWGKELYANDCNFAEPRVEPNALKRSEY
jgi:hypothetical protein